MSADALRVVLVDDHPLFLSGLRAMVQRAPGVVWSGDAGTGEDALELLSATACDVVLMDLRMPGIGGLAATRQLLARPAAPAVIVLTMAEDDASVFAALRAGARGYLLKGADEDEILAAVRLVASGGVVLGPAVAARMIDHLDRPAPVPDLPFPELTAQERRVLELLATGRPTAGIATELSLSTKTVRNYLSSTYAKLQVTDRYEAIARARESGLGR